MQMITYLEEKEIREAAKVTKTSLHGYILHMEEQGKAATTISRMMAAMKAFFNYECMQACIRRNPAESLHAPKVEKKAPVILSVDQVSALLAQPSGQTPKEIRDKAMLALLYATGIRVSELIGIQMEDINMNIGFLVCRDGERERTIPFGRSAKAALEEYLERDMSFTGILCMALLQMVQVWSIVISGVIVNVAAGVVYGVWRAFAICLISSSLAHGISFTVCQHLGKYLDKILPDTGSYKLDLIAKSDHPAYTVVTLCFLPILPNGIISIAASRSRLKPWEFTLAMFCGSAFSVFVYCWLGSSLVQGDWIASAVLVVFMLAVAFLMLRYQKQILHFTDRLMEKRKKHHGKQHTDISES